MGLQKPTLFLKATTYRVSWKISLHIYW